MLESKGRTGVRQRKQVTILHGRGAFHSTKTFENLETAAMVQKFPEKFPEILETVEFPKCEPFNRKFWKFWEQS